MRLNFYRILILSPMNTKQTTNILFLLKNRGLLTLRTTVGVFFDRFDRLSIRICVREPSIFLLNLQSMASFLWPEEFLRRADRQSDG